MNKTNKNSEKINRPEQSGLTFAEKIKLIKITGMPKELCYLNYVLKPNIS